MTFGQWEVIETGSMTASLDLTTPIVGDGSVFINSPTTALNQGLALQVSAASGITRGIARGKIRTLVTYVSGNTSNNSTFSGIYCLATSANFGSGTGTAYVAGFNANGGDVELRKIILTNPAVTPLGSANVSFVQGSVFSLELEWDDNTTEYGGYYFTVRSGTATDFSDLMTRFSVIDPITAAHPGYEGLVHIQDTTVASSYKFDNTSIFTIS